jgi:hypothetical protein
MGVRLLRVNGQLFCSLFTIGPKGYAVVKNALPDDARITNGAWDIVRNELILRIESESFGEVPDGFAISELDPILIQSFPMMESGIY